MALSGAKLQMAQFGQYGSGLLDSGEIIDLSSTATSDSTIGNEYIVVAITMLEPTKFTALEGCDPRFVGTTTPDWDADFGAGGATTNSDNGNAVASTDSFPQGLTIFGKWDKITVNSGSVLFYVAPRH
jgi:hypothetical protein